MSTENIVAKKYKKRLEALRKRKDPEGVLNAHGVLKNASDSIPEIDNAFKDETARKVAVMMATSHEYKNPNVEGALAFAKNYRWTEGTMPLSRLQGINKPIKKAKVAEIAKTLEEQHDRVDWPFVVVDKLNGIRPQSFGKRILIDGHHRFEACKERGIEEVPVYIGVWTGAAEKPTSELKKLSFENIVMEKLAAVSKSYVISAEEEMHDRIEKFLSVTSKLGLRGSSRDVVLYVDGDGNDRAELEKVDGEKPRDVVFVDDCNKIVVGRDVKFKDDATSEDLEKMNSDGEVFDIEKIAEEVSFNKLDEKRKAHIAHAAGAGHMVKIRYQDKKGNLTERIVEPYKMVGNDLWAFDPEKDSIRRFKIKGLKSTKETKQGYQPRWEIEMDGVDKIAMEKLASKRSNHRKAIQKTIGSDPSSEIENLVFDTIYNDEEERGRTDDFDEFGRLQSSRYPGMYIGGDDGDELLTANNDVVNSSDRYHELLTQALEERPDLKALYDVDKAQNAKRRHTPIADTMGQTGAILGGVGGLVYPAFGIANSIKNKHYGRAALKGLVYPISGTVSAALGALVGGVTAGGIGTMIESPVKGVQGLIDKDYKAYDDFTWDQAKEIKDMKQRFMSQADRETLERAFGSEIADQVLGAKLAAAFERDMEKLALQYEMDLGVGRGQEFQDAGGDSMSETFKRTTAPSLGLLAGGAGLGALVAKKMNPLLGAMVGGTVGMLASTPITATQTMRDFKALETMSLNRLSDEERSGLTPREMRRLSFRSKFGIHPKLATAFEKDMEKFAASYDKKNARRARAWDHSPRYRTLENHIVENSGYDVDSALFLEDLEDKMRTMYPEHHENFENLGAAHTKTLVAELLGMLGGAGAGALVGSKIGKWPNTCGAPGAVVGGILGDRIGRASQLRQFADIDVNALNDLDTAYSNEMRSRVTPMSPGDIQAAKDADKALREQRRAAIASEMARLEANRIQKERNQIMSGQKMASSEMNALEKLAETLSSAQRRGLVSDISKGRKSKSENPKKPRYFDNFRTGSPVRSRFVIGSDGKELRSGDLTLNTTSWGIGRRNQQLDLEHTPYGVSDQELKRLDEEGVLEDLARTRAANFWKIGLGTAAGGVAGVAGGLKMNNPDLAVLTALTGILGGAGLGMAAGKSMPKQLLSNLDDDTLIAIRERLQRNHDDAVIDAESAPGRMTARNTYYY